MSRAHLYAPRPWHANLAHARHRFVLIVAIAASRHLTDLTGTRVLRRQASLVVARRPSTGCIPLLSERYSPAPQIVFPL